MALILCPLTATQMGPKLWHISLKRFNKGVDSILLPFIPNLVRSKAFAILQACVRSPGGSFYSFRVLPNYLEAQGSDRSGLGCSSLEDRDLQLELASHMEASEVKFY